MAFADLKSEEAQARLSVCQPISGLQEVTRVGGVERCPAVVIIFVAFVACPGLILNQINFEPA